MLNVMVVEDDIVARNRICSMVDWNALGYQIVAEVSNGFEALKLVESHRPHVVLSDVSMPVMDGIELSQELLKLSPDIHLIMVSSHSDYNYIRETFRNGAADYLLKEDLTPEILSGLLKENKQKLSNKVSAKQDILPAQRLTDILVGIGSMPVPDEDFLSSLGFEKKVKKYALIIFCLYYYEHLIRNMDAAEKLMHSRSILAFLEELFMDKPHQLLWMGNGQIALLIPAEEASMACLQSRVDETISKVDQCLFKYLEIKSRHEWQLFNKKELPGSYSIVFDKLNNSSKTLKDLTFPYIMKIMDALQQADNVTYELYLKELFDQLKNGVKDMWSVQPVILFLLNLLDKVIGWQNLKPVQEDYVPENIYHCNNLDELYLCIKKCFEAVFMSMGPNSGRRMSPHIKKAIAYIREHYREQITLAKLADYVGVAPNYLSGQFSAETGMTFVELLNNIRIENAEKLMQSTDCSIKELYYQVGFNSYNYFFKVYRDIKGKSPVQKNRK